LYFLLEKYYSDLKPNSCGVFNIFSGIIFNFLYFSSISFFLFQKGIWNLLL